MQGKLASAEVEEIEKVARRESVAPDTSQLCPYATDEDFVPNHARRNLDENSCHSQPRVSSAVVGGVSYFWY